MSRLPSRGPRVLVFALLSAAVLAGCTAGVGAARNPLDVSRPVSTVPVLIGAACTGTPGNLVVTGEGFTPGGEVDLVLARPGSTEPGLRRTVRASLPVFGPNGSTDPALGFTRGGTVSADLGPHRGMTAMVWARDRRTATWSDGLTIGVCHQTGR